MVKRNRSKQSNKGLSGNTPDTLEKKGSTTHPTRSGAKGKRARKNNVHAKRASKKNTYAKKTKRTGRKTGGRKAAHHEEHEQTQTNEPVADSNE
jgi:hypothetical protein